MDDGERVGRVARPTGAVVDSRSVKTTESGGVRGYDAGKKIEGRKRHAMVERSGNTMVALVGKDAKVAFRPVRIVSTGGIVDNIGDTMAPNVPNEVTDGSRVRTAVASR